MLAARTLKILAAILIGYAVLSIPAWFGPAYLEALSSHIYMTPVLSIHFFHYLGIPGLLEHDGACGWGICSPTPFGIMFTAAFWLGVTWLIAWGIARLTSH